MSLIVGLGLGCTVTANVGQECPPVIINEVMSASDSYTIEGRDSTSDWFELHNQGKPVAHLEGYVLIGHSDWDRAFIFPPGFIVAGGAHALFIAGSYIDGESLVPEVGFDFNGDADSLELRAPESADHMLCDSVFVPDQHQGYSWQRDPDAGKGGSDTWCDSSEPSPGAENERCLCAGNDDC